MADTGWQVATTHTLDVLEESWDHGSGDPDNVNTDNTDFAAADGTLSVLVSTSWHGFDFSSVPSGATIDAIDVRIRGYDDFGDGGWHLEIALAWSGDTQADDTNFTTETRMPSSGDLGGTSGSPATHTVDAKTSRTWAVSELTTANFRVRVQRIGDSFHEESRLEFLEARVTYTAAGGGGSKVPLIIQQH